MDPEFAECDFKVTSADDIELLDEVKNHMMSVHGFEEAELDDPDMEDKIFAVAKEAEDEEDMFEEGNDGY